MTPENSSISNPLHLFTVFLLLFPISSSKLLQEDPVVIEARHDYPNISKYVPSLPKGSIGSIGSIGSMLNTFQWSMNPMTSPSFFLHRRRRQRRQSRFNAVKQIFSKLETTKNLESIDRRLLTYYDKRYKNKRPLRPFMPPPRGHRPYHGRLHPQRPTPRAKFQGFRPNYSWSGPIVPSNNYYSDMDETLDEYYKNLANLPNFIKDYQSSYLRPPLPPPSSSSSPLPLPPLSPNPLSSYENFQTNFLQNYQHHDDNPSDDDDEDDEDENDENRELISQVPNSHFISDEDELLSPSPQPKNPYLQNYHQPQTYESNHENNQQNLNFNCQNQNCQENHNLTQIMEMPQIFPTVTIEALNDILDLNPQSQGQDSLEDFENQFPQIFQDFEFPKSIQIPQNNQFKLNQTMTPNITNGLMLVVMRLNGTSLSMQNVLPKHLIPTSPNLTTQNFTLLQPHNFTLPVAQNFTTAIIAQKLMEMITLQNLTAVDSIKQNSENFQNTSELIPQNSMSPDVPQQMLTSQFLSLDSKQMDKERTARETVPLDMSLSMSTEMHYEDGQHTEFKKALLDELIQRLKALELGGSKTKNFIGLPFLRRIHENGIDESLEFVFRQKKIKILKSTIRKLLNILNI